MKTSFEKVKEYLLELNYTILQEDKEDSIFVVECEEDGITNLVIGCADPILIMEQYLLEAKSLSNEELINLLQKNRDMIHGAFALDESGRKIIFRDTLQIENLDKNELEGSLNSLSLLLSEYSEELIKISKN